MQSPAARLFFKLAFAALLPFLVLIPAPAGAQAPFAPLVEARLTAGDAELQDQFGFAVSVSGDRVLVGAFVDDDGGTLAGAAYVYSFDGTSWVEDAKLVASDAAPFDFFGFSVALSGDRALVGAFGKNSEEGAAYIFDFDGTTWSESARLTASDGAPFADFGLAVGLDGDRAVVGALGASSAGLQTGAAYVFFFDGASWLQEERLAPSDGAAGDNFGRSVAIDGGRVAVGADGADPSGASSGATYVYDLSGGTWNESGKLTASDGAASDFLGEAVAVSGDLVLAGAPQDDDAGTGSGSAYLFRFDGVAWSEEAKLTASDAATSDHFGAAVAVNGDRALVGAFGNDGAGLDAGSGYVFSHDGTSWSEETRLVGSDTEAGDAFGVSVSLDGDRAALGAAGDDGSTGSAFVFSVQSGEQHPFLLVADSTVLIEQQIDIFGHVHSNGSIDVRDGLPSTITGNLTALLDIDVGPDQTIDGDVLAGGTATIDPLATVTGAVVSGAPVAPFPLPTFTFVAGGANINVPANATVGLSPGSYGRIKVNRRATLVLSHDGVSGDYFFEQLEVENQGRIEVHVFSGAVEVNIVDSMILEQRTHAYTVPGGRARDIVYNMRLGGAVVRQRSRVTGSLIAPGGKVVVQQRSRVEGSICARDIEFLQRSVVSVPGPSPTPSPASSPAAASPTRGAPPGDGLRGGPRSSERGRTPGTERSRPAGRERGR